ncbi:MAG: Rrf2 family transcriptional regulator [Patescibacteria group bacterium]|nr:Rrf2 family transcriptional regulator [Patescibacteria group bacterium]
MILLNLTILQLVIYSEPKAQSMFGLKRKTNYGLEVLIFLARNFGGKPISLRQIAQERKLPYKYLEQIVIPLRESGIIEAKEGKGGGYFLNRDPKRILVSEIIKVLEDNVELGQCSGCSMAKKCNQKDLWTEVSNKINEIIKGKSLADLC